MTTLSILVVGLLLGMKHATEARHLAAVATLATLPSSLAQTPRPGLPWGVGHTLRPMRFGGAMLLLGQVISPGLEQALETAVGMMLFVLGADALRGLDRDRNAAMARTPSRRTSTRTRSAGRSRSARCTASPARRLVGAGGLTLQTIPSSRVRHRLCAPCSASGCSAAPGRIRGDRDRLSQGAARRLIGAVRAFRRRRSRCSATGASCPGRRTSPRRR
jgi:hypothetical protein